MNWLHHFIHHIKHRRKDAWLLLIVDKFKSHATVFFFKLAAINNIILFRLLAHSTHFTQSLNVKIFQSYKYYYVETVDAAMRLKNRKFEKLKFFAAFQTFRNQIFKSSIIRHVFRITEIVSFNFNMIFDIIRQKISNLIYQFRIFNSQFQLIKFFFKKSKSIKKFEQKIERALKNIESNENTMIKKNVDQIQRFVQSTMTAVNTLNFIIRDFNMFQRVTSIRRICAELINTVAAKKRVMKINQCRELCFIRQKTKWNEKRNEKRKKRIRSRNRWPINLQR